MRNGAGNGFMTFNTESGNRPSAYEDATDALYSLNSDCDRDTWLKALMGYKDAVGDKGYNAALAWSAQSEKFNQSSFDATWKSIQANGPITKATLFKMAIAAGYRYSHSSITTSQKKDEKNARAQKNAHRILQASQPAPADHPYLLRKQVAPTITLHEIHARSAINIIGYSPKNLFSSKWLVVPIGDQEKIVTLEFIDEQGNKHFLSGGKKASYYWAAEPIATDYTQVILIAEGVATALSLQQATGYVVIAAMDAGNLKKVALRIQAQYPQANIIICGDLGNGADKALDAADSIRSLCVLPHFVGDRPDWANDFNDLALLHSNETVAAQIKAADEEKKPEEFFVGLDETNPLEAEIQLLADMSLIDYFSVRKASAERLCLPMTQMDSLVKDKQRSNKIKEKLEKEKLVVEKTEKRIHNLIDTQNPYQHLFYENGIFYVQDGWIVFDSGKEAATPIKICSYIEIVGQARTHESSGWGRLLRWWDNDKQLHQWILPLEDVQGDCLEIRRYLAREGIIFGASQVVSRYLPVIFQLWPTVEKRVRILNALGWNGSSYMTPTACYSAMEEDEYFCFQNPYTLKPNFAISGTTLQWQQHVAYLAVGNSRAVFSISIAFAAALVELSGQDSGGFSWRGHSSIGKTTLLRMAASVYGNPEKYIRNWRSTANGLEGLAALHNDALLVLDELSMCDPKTASESAYLLAGGQGKNRARQHGEAKESHTWRLLFLSSGEINLSTLIGRRTNAGEEIRFADIEADAGCNLGAFECLHEYDSPVTFTVAIKDATAHYHGQVFIDWIKALAKDRLLLAKQIKDSIDQFMFAVVPAHSKDNGQISRMARRMGLVATAGELATSYGLTGWPMGEATQAAKHCFAIWLSGFGVGNKEDRDVIEHTRQFFLAHGSSRFQPKEAPNNDSDYKVINRVGFYSDENGQRQYLVPDAGMKEIYKGFDLKRVKKVLADHGLIIVGESGLNTHRCRIPSEGINIRVYIFDSCALNEEKDEQ